MGLKSRLRWFLGLLISIVLAAFDAGIIVGPQAAVSVVAFAGTLAGALAGLPRLTEGGEETETNPKPTLSQAEKEQAALEAKRAPVPPSGGVSGAADKKAIFERWAVNDVSASYFVKGRSAEYLYKRGARPKARVLVAIRGRLRADAVNDVRVLRGS